ncbi:NADPH-dependent F420 reductase [Demequina aurantiaca]|uniref:NADPH-dependent F420 reductase n=1 Tax=Demequina aurantiaca TaxID=676200 RepID=UPI001F1936BE|nr:NAD(P)-binding domain-containing protein [Demequina aurantiaca]
MPQNLQDAPAQAHGPVGSLGIIGAGRVGAAVARLALTAGYEVVIAGSGSPERIATFVGYEAPGARPVMASDAAAADLVVLAIPLGKFRSLPVNALRGALVIDAMNYWWEYDGAIPELNDPLTSTSETLQVFLSEARVVKTLNHMSVYALEHEARAAGDPERKALAVAGDDDDAVARVVQFVERIGFDAVVAGPLAQGMKLEPHTALFAADEDAAEVRAILDRFWQSQRGRVVARARGLV